MQLLSFRPIETCRVQIPLAPNKERLGIKNFTVTLLCSDSMWKSLVTIHLCVCSPGQATHVNRLCRKATSNYTYPYHRRRRMTDATNRLSHQNLPSGRAPLYI